MNERHNISMFSLHTYVISSYLKCDMLMNHLSESFKFKKTIRMSLSYKGVNVVGKTQNVNGLAFQ